MTGEDPKPMVACPFCGKTNVVTWTRLFSDDGRTEYLGHVCRSERGGCGKHFDTERPTECEIRPLDSPNRGHQRRRKCRMIANIIQGEVGFFNGWAVSKESERDSCEKAAEKILARIERWKRPTMKSIEAK